MDIVHIVHHIVLLLEEVRQGIHPGGSSTEVIGAVSLSGSNTRGADQRTAHYLEVAIDREVTTSCVMIDLVCRRQVQSDPDPVCRAVFVVGTESVTFYT